MREQFGQKIGAFQAIKHLCAEMLETSESVTAAAWDAARAPATTTPSSTSSPRWSPGPSASTAPSRSRRTCIQVLGGIGFTFEHDAHLYLRRALGLRSLLGPTGSVRRSAGRPRRNGHPPRGPRRPRRCRGELPRPRSGNGRSGSPTCPRRSRRAALAESGYLTPALAGAARPGCRPGAAAGHRRGARSRRGLAPRPEDRRLGRADDHRPRHRRAAQAVRRADADAARSSGASCSASPARARTSRR